MLDNYARPGATALGTVPTRHRVAGPGEKVIEELGLGQDHLR
jgi:hypothetical protein